MNLVTRVILSFISLTLFGWLDVVLNPVSTILTGQAAGQQFEDSNFSYVKSVVEMHAFSHIGVPSILILVVLLSIWWSPLKRLFSKLKDEEGGTKTADAIPPKTNPKVPGIVIGTLLALGLFTGSTQDAQAYYQKTDYAEPYFILPNESAFYIPDAGANKESQTKFESEQYFAENKISAKRFLVPHTVLQNSGVFSNYVVPAGRLIIVDRTPYNREWVKSESRGTSAKDESFPCQTSEGINVGTGVSIAASVTEDNAAKFLYYFGVNPPQGDRTDPNVIFTSVYYGKSLHQVMDTVVRGKIQALVCNEMTKRTLDKANAEASLIMDVISKNVGDFLASRGITLDYIGWADTFEFDKEVQRAINDRFVAATVASAMPVLQQQANMDVKEGLAEGLKKGLPSFLPANISNWIMSMFGVAPSADLPKVK